MRIYTTAILFLTVLLCSATKVLAVPTVTITNLKHACGGQGNGAFNINVTAATGANLTVRVFGPPSFTPIIETMPMPALPFTYAVSGLTGLSTAPGEEYIVIVTDGTGNKTDFVYILDFTASIGTITQNTNPGCATPNGAIDINLVGSGAGAIQYTWTGPIALPNTQDLTNLPGGSYSLQYTDGTTTCTLGPIIINDPTPTAFTATAGTPICAGSVLGVNISTADNGWTYSVMEGVTVLASAAGAGGPLTINVPGLSTGGHTLRVAATAGSCPPQNSPNFNVVVSPTPLYLNYNNNAVPGGICSNAALGVNLATLKDPTSTAATSFRITGITSTGLVANGGGIPTVFPVVGLPAGVLADDQWLNTTNGSLDVIYTLIPVINACTGPAFTVRVTIKPQPDYNNHTDTTPGICSRDALGVMLDPLRKGTSVLATSYNVTGISSTGLTATGGSPALGATTSAGISDDRWQNVSNVAVNVVYTIVPITAGCSGSPFTVTVAINPQPDYNDLTNTTPGVCSGDALAVDLATLQKGTSIAAASFNITNIAPNGATIEGGAPATGTGLAANVIADDRWKNVTNAAVNVVYTVEPVIGTCTGNPFFITVAVKPEPDYDDHMNLSGICSEAAVGLDLVTLKKVTSVTATTYNIISIASTGLTATAGAPAIGTALPSTEIADDRWENITSAPLNVVYTIEPVSADNCVGDSFTVDIWIAPEPDFNNYNDDNAPGGICSADAIGLDLATLKKATSVNALTYDITSIVSTGLTAGAGTPGLGTDVPASEIADDSWINTTAGALTVTYTIVPKTAVCSGDPFTVLVTINPRPDYNNLPAGAGFCAVPIGVDLAPLQKVGSIAATTFNITNIASGAATAVAGSPANGTGLLADVLADDVWSNVTSSTINVVYTIVPVTGTCAGNPFTVTVAILAQPDYNDFAAPTCSSVAFNVNLDLRKTPASAVATQYDVINFVADPGLTNVSATPVGLGTVAGNMLTDTWENVTNGPLGVTYTIIPTAGSCTGAPFDIVITINPEPVYTTYNNNNVPGGICSEDAVNVDLSTLRVPTSVVAPSFTATAVSVPAGLIPAGATPALGVPQTGNAMVIADDMWRNVTNASLNIQYTVTAESGLGCVSKPFTVTVTVNPQPDYNNYNNTAVPGGICSNTALGVDLATLQKGTSVTATTFNITAISSTGLTGGVTAPINGVASTAIAADVWRNLTNAPVDVEYTIVPFIAACAGDPFTVRVTIQPEPDYNNLNNTVGVCSRAALGLDLLTLKVPASVAATSYEITTISSAGLTAAGGAPSTGAGLGANVIADDQWLNNSNAPIDVTYTIIPTNGSCVGDVFTVTIRINPEPFSNNAVKDICDNTSTNFDLQVDAINLLGNALPGNTFSWTVAANPNVTGQTASSGGTINNTLDNTTSSDQVVVYTVTPTSSLGCAGAPFLVSITVHPTPVIAAGQTAEACAGTSIGYEIKMNPLNEPAGTTFTWPDPDGIFLPGQPGNIPMGPAGTIHINDALLVLSGASDTYNYNVTPHIGSCSGPMVPIVVTIHRAATVNAGPAVSLCTDNGEFTLSGASRGGSSTVATWTVISEPSPGHADLDPDAGTAMASPGTASFFATVPGDYVLELVTDDPPTVCGPVSDTRVITVTARPVVAASQAKTICGNDPVAYEILMDPLNTPPNTVFNWPDPDGSGPAQAGVNVDMGTPGTLHINEILINNGIADITVPYVITPSVGLCVGDPVTVLITVRPSPVVALNQMKTICSGDQVDYEILLTPANMPPTTKFSWPDPDGSGPATSRMNVDADPAGTLHITDRLYNGSAAPIQVIYQVISLGANGCRGVTRDITITVNPGAIAEAGSAQAICSSGTATLAGASVSIGGVAANGTWAIRTSPAGGGNGVITPGATPAAATFTATLPGDYELELTSDDPSGACNPVTDVVTITVKSPGDPSCTGGIGTCTGVQIAPIPSPATCNNSDGSVHFDINPAAPITGGVKITIDGTGPTTLPVPRTNFNNFDFPSLPVGTYSYEIEYGDATCIKTGVFAIDRSGTIGTPVVSNIIDPLCFGTTGTATIDAPGETGHQLEWSSDGITWTPFIAGSAVNGLPAGSNMISVRQNSGDPCASGVVITLAAPADITSTITAADATCNNNDGSITLAATAGGTGPYTYELNGTPTNLPASGTFVGLTANTYAVTIIDSKGCRRTLNATVSFPGFVANSGPVVSAPNCSGGGTNGRVDITITDPGSFQFALTTDLTTEPTSYNNLGGSVVSQSNLANGAYAIWLKPQGAGVKCATKILFTVAGIYTVDFAATKTDVVCFSDPATITVSAFTGAPALPYSYTLIRTNNNSTTTGTISAAQALGTYTINNVVPGNYLLTVTQDQSSIVAACTAPISGGGETLVVSGPTAALDSLYVDREISYPDMGSGSAVVGVQPSGLAPYETRLELTVPILVGQEFASDWKAVQLNANNLKLEQVYTNLFAGVYTLGIRDAGGCEKTYTFLIDVDRDLFIPNIFTPNGDGSNEVFYIRNLPAESKLLVTNRWGKEVFRSEHYLNDWNGGDAVAGVYYYTLKLGSEAYTGWVEILR